jgi:predicted PurR-regulated permease PerM
MTSDADARRLWPIVQGVGIALVLALFLWASREILNPLFLFVVLVVALQPFRGRPGYSLLVALAGTITAVWVLSTTGSLLAPFILALGVAYILDPLVDRIQATGRGRTTSVLLLALPVVGGLVAVLLLALPALWTQAGELIDRSPVILDRLEGWAAALELRLRGVPGLTEIVLQPIVDLDADAIVAFLDERKTLLAEQAWSGVLGIGRGLGSALTLLGYLVITPVLTFYLLRDWDRITHHLGELIPRPRRESVVSFAREYDRLLARYLRGQISVAATIGGVTALGLWISGFPYAFLLGVTVAVFGVVPYLGLVLSLIPAVLVALTSGAVGLSLLKVGIVFAVAQGLEGAVVSPRIVGDSVGLHPVWVVLALTVGGFYFGFVGLLIGVPAAVGVKLLVLRGLERYRSSDLYQGGEGAAA